MATQDLYTTAPSEPGWNVEMAGSASFTWEYDDGRDKLLALYQKGKDKQWDAAKRIDWDLEVDPYDALGTPDQAMAIYGTKWWDKLGPENSKEMRLHFASWQFSQFLHGEQGAMICAARIVESVPDLDAKFYAATQTMDEARHAEIYARFLHDKLGMLYPINDQLQALLKDTLNDSRWDMPYLGMQVLIEGLALAAFGLLRDITTKPLPKQILAYVMQDEARHVAFGRMALRDYYKQLSSAELARARGLRHRGLLPHAGPDPRRRDLGQLRHPQSRTTGDNGQLGLLPHVPVTAVQPDGALRPRYRPVERAAAAGVRRHGRARRGQGRPRRPDEGRRGDSREARRRALRRRRDRPRHRSRRSNSLRHPLVSPSRGA